MAEHHIEGDARAGLLDAVADADEFQAFAEAVVDAGDHIGEQAAG